jgi:hypothetical protein
MFHNQGVMIGIPIYNVEKTIINVLTGFDTFFWGSIKTLNLIDNHSSDGTKELLNEFVTNHPELSQKLKITFKQKNMGYGHSVKSIINNFVNSECQYLLIFHGDDHTDWNHVFRQAQSRLHKGFDAVFFSRFINKQDSRDYSIIKNLVNRYINLMYSFAIGTKTSDYGAAIVLISKKVLDVVEFNNISEDFMFHPIFNAKIHKSRNLHKIEIPLEWKSSSTKSNVPVLSFLLDIHLFIISMLIERLKKKFEMHD